MNCPICRSGEFEPGTATVMLNRDDTVVIVKNVPADVCNQCGEYVLNEEVADRVSTLADGAVKRGAEVEILRYAA